MNQPLVNNAEHDDEPFLSRPSAGLDVYDGPQGVGATIQKLRAAKRLSLAEASGRLKFSVRHLQALDDERWACLPTAVSLRGPVHKCGSLLDCGERALWTLATNSGEPDKA